MGFNGEVFVDNVVMPNLLSSGNGVFEIYVLPNFSFSISHWSVFMARRENE